MFSNDSQRCGASPAPRSPLALVALTLAGAPASAQAAGGSGYVRLAHLSPDTPAVDVYLKS